MFIATLDCYYCKFSSGDKVDRLRVDNAIQMHESFPVTLFIKLYEVVLTFGSPNKMLKCHHENKRYVY